MATPDPSSDNRPPTVPTSRIRFTLMANHTQSQLQQAIKVLKH